MTGREQLKEIVSKLYRTPAETIGPDFQLARDRFRGSAGRGLLAAAIRRSLGVYVAQSFSAGTYGELEAAVFGHEGNGSHVAEKEPPGFSAAHAPRADEALDGAVSVGVDIEMIESLPDAADFWTSDFYRTHFTGAEIAYCIRQQNPRMHFAARWCAKEALAKCDARFVHIDPTTIQIVLMTDGRPSFERVHAGSVERLPHAVSLTHTPVMAAAVVAVAGRRDRMTVPEDSERE
jgi:phosphopantetheine--protein transferase-like protein